MADVEITGSGQGASREVQRVGKDFDKLGVAGERAAKKIERANKQTTRSTREFEKAVEDATRKLQAREQRAKATAEAERRLGVAQPQTAGGAAPSRARARAPAQPAGPGRVQTAGTGVGLVGTALGGTGGGVLGTLGTTLGAVAAGLGPVALGLAGLGFAIAGVISAINENKEALKIEAAARKQVSQGIQAAQAAAGRQALQNVRANFNPILQAEFAGQQLQNFLGEGISFEDAAGIGRILAGTEPTQREQLLEDLRLVARLGGRPDAAAAERIQRLRFRGRGGDIFGGRNQPATQAQRVQAGVGDPNLSVGQVDQALRGQGLAAARIGQFSRARQAQAAIERARIEGTFNNLDQVDAGAAEIIRGLVDPIGVEVDKLIKQLEANRETQEENFGDDSPIVEKLDEILSELQESRVTGNYNPQRPR